MSIFTTQRRLMRASDQLTPNRPCDISIHVADFVANSHAAVRLARACENFRKVTSDLVGGILEEHRSPDIQALFYLGLIAEEFAETLYAFGDRDLAGVLDGLTDMQVVEHGAGHSLGLPLESAWHEVANSNRSKIDPESGKIPRSADGKWIKPETFVRPDLARILHAAKEGTL